MNQREFERALARQARLCRIDDVGPVVVGVSGGPDSTALLAGLTAIGVEAVAAHLDHGLRADSDRDRAAAAALAERLGVPFVAERAEVAPGPRGSLEDGARRARYTFLERTARTRGATSVAVGHTRDDQVETIAHRLLRGTGLTGLGGMTPTRRLAPGLRLTRPLLVFPRDEVHEYARARGLPSVVDPSNDDLGFTRNRLRREVLPALFALNPRLDRALLRLARQARRARRNLDKQAWALLEAATRPDGWDAAALADADPAARAQALAKIAGELARGEAGARHVRLLEQVVSAGGAATLPGGVRLERIGDRLALAAGAGPARCPSAPLPLPVPGDVDDLDAGLRFSARRVPRPERLETDPRERVLVDAARVAGSALAVRRRRSGDRFWPLGAPGHRSLKRFFIDQRVPREMRDHVPVVTVDDQPLWIVGHRLDEQFKVTPTTAEVLELRASKAVCGLEVSS